MRREGEKGRGKISNRLEQTRNGEMKIGNKKREGERMKGDAQEKSRKA